MHLLQVVLNSKQTDVASVTSFIHFKEALNFNFNNHFCLQLLIQTNLRYDIQIHEQISFKLQKIAKTMDGELPPSLLQPFLFFCIWKNPHIHQQS